MFKTSASTLRRCGALGLLCLAGVVGVAGCATPPPYTAVNHQRVVTLSSVEVWRRLHAFLQDQGIAVVAEDPGAGIIDAQQVTPGRGLLAAYAACGGGNPLQIRQRQTMDLTIRVTPVPDGAQVIAHAAFSQTLRSRRAGALTVACESNGVIEAAVLNVASGQPMEAAPVPRFSTP